MPNKNVLFLVTGQDLPYYPCMESECIADDSAGPQNIKRAWVPRETLLETFFTHYFCEYVLLRSV